MSDTDETRTIAGREWRVVYGVLQMQRANLTGANLRRENLAGANLRRAILTGADLTDANLMGAQMPRRFVHIPSGGALMRVCWAWLMEAGGTQIHMGCHTGGDAFPSFDDARAHYQKSDYDGTHKGDVRQVLAALDYAESVAAIRREEMEKADG